MDERENKDKEKETIIRFLLETKDGKYAPVNTEFIKYTRVKETRQPQDENEYYYYGIS
jgi:hypothetical protein